MLKIFKSIILFSLMCFVLSCSTIKSGHFVQIKSTDTIETLSKEFNIPKEKIISANQDKKISTGEWIFIPLKRGILSETNMSQAYDPKLYLGSGQFLWPVPSSSKISSGFGHRWGRPHEGVDIPGKVGAHIVAADDGVVVYSGSEIGGYGNITVLAHRNGFFTVYAHAQSNYTRQGQRVYRGQVIAQVGMTGRTYGPHLHFEVRRNGEAIDPVMFLASN